jgi:hypothetical protein
MLITLAVFQLLKSEVNFFAHEKREFIPVTLAVSQLEKSPTIFSAHINA